MNDRPRARLGSDETFPGHVSEALDWCEEAQQPGAQFYTNWLTRRYVQVLHDEILRLRAERDQAVHDRNPHWTAP